MKNLGDVLKLATAFLEKHKVARSRLVSESLLAHFLGMKRIELYMHFDRPMLEGELEPFREGLKRAKLGEPFEYITGSVPFFECQIGVNGAVLIPRQETEILLDHVTKRLTGNEVRALDLCTGSGCLAIGLKKACPDMDVFGVDLSKEALEMARQNGEANGVDIHWLQGDLTEPVKGMTFDLVLCNPPYISEKEYASLDRCVKEFEPKMALVSGSTGFEFYERLEKELPPILNPGAQGFFEIGSTQGPGMKARFLQGKWKEIELFSDFAGHDRFFSLKM